MMTFDPVEIDPERAIWELLSKREREVLALLASGYSNYGIGRRLFSSESTVANQISNLYEKACLNTRNVNIDRRVALTVWFWEIGRYEDDDD